MKIIITESQLGKLINESISDFSYFETSQGSKYIRNSKGQLRRWKSYHSDTGGEDMGLHGWSNFSIFVDPKFRYEANSLQYLIGNGYRTAMAKNKDGKIVIMLLDGGNWRPAKWNDAYPAYVKQNPDYDNRTLMFEYTKEPTIGYNVVDFDLKPNSTKIDGYHFGSVVSRVEDSIPDDVKSLFFKNK